MAKAQQYISDLTAGGRYHFSAAEMAKTLGISRNAPAARARRAADWLPYVNGRVEPEA